VADERTKAERTRDIFVTILALVIFAFCSYGFGGKLLELVRLVKESDSAASEGVFAVAPLMNYLLASAGFLCMLGWAACHGMFRDIERPKQTMLEYDQQLDERSTDAHFSDSILNGKARD
jgi:hypothetical protein